MRRILRYWYLLVKLVILAILVYTSISSSVQAACTCRQYECSAGEIEQDLCSGGRVYCCTVPTSTPKPTATKTPTPKPAATATPKPPTNTPVPTSAPISCSSNNYCQNLCPNTPECTAPIGSCSGTCNNSTGKCSFTCGPQTGCPNNNWGSWGTCDPDYQARFCNSNPQAYQIRACMTPTPTGGTGGPTNTPKPTNNPTNTPIPTIVPTLAPAYIRVRTMNSAGQNVKSTTLRLCKANCTNAPCTFYGGALACVSDVSSNDFNNAEDNRGGAIRTSDYIVLGVTPMLNNVVNTSNGVYSATCRGVGAGNYCYFWTAPLASGRREVRFIVATLTPTNIPTPTDTPVPTPTTGPGPWVKLKDSSFVSVNGLYQGIPASPVAYDSDDTTQAFFIIGDSGVGLASTINLDSLNPSAKLNSPNWENTYNTASYSMTSANFISYIKARKEFKEITGTSQINSDGIYLYTGSNPLNLASVPGEFNQYNVVLVTAGTININTANFNPTKSIAILANRINFAATTTDAKGIFIGSIINTGTNANLGLKIVGNLAAQTNLNNNREQTNANKPSLFITFDPSIYLNLLPYFSVANYEWEQLQ